MSSIYGLGLAKDNIIDLIKKIDKNIEVELSINQNQKLTQSKYNNLARYLVDRADRDGKPDNLSEMETLDIIYKYSGDTPNVYRVSISTAEKINKIMSKVAIRNNHSIFSILVRNYKDGKTKDVEIMHKIKDYKNYVDILDYDMRMRLAHELPITNEEYETLLHLGEEERTKIMFRLKRRLKYVVKIDKTTEIHIDLTAVETKNRLNVGITYELEVEIVSDEKIKNPENIYNKLFDEVYLLHSVLQESAIILKTTDKNKVLQTMIQLLYDEKTNKRADLPAMQSESLASVHISALSAKYSITDKADGERAFLLIMDERLFIINNNLYVKEVPIKTYKNLANYNNTIIDGEYIYIEKNNKFMFLGFDILYYKNKDVRQEPELEKRLKFVDELMKDVFNVKSSHEGYEKTGKDGVINMDDILSYYTGIIKEYFNEMNKKLETDEHIIMHKLFFIPKGIYNSELFAYSKLVWDLYTGAKVNCPYVLDGLIYTGLIQIYTRTIADIHTKIYKWKPPHMNTIDFYVKFEKDADTGNIINVFDNSKGNNLDDKLDTIKVDELLNDAVLLDEIEDYTAGNHIYRIANLYVGSTRTGAEQPVLFGEADNLYIANFYIEDGEVRDELGNKIDDGMVIECSYDNDVMKEHAFRWKIVRVRIDKTESVRLQKKKYGNNEQIAKKVWESINNPFDINDIYLLADENTFETHMEKIKSKITSEDIAELRKSDAYYQLQNKLMQPMRDFHNFIKTNIMHKYCGKRMTIDNKSYSMDVLDIGIGRGGDMARYFSSRVKSLVGIDPDPQGLFTTDDGAKSRYDKFQRKFQHMIFALTLIVADGTGTFDLESQEKLITKMTESNKNNIINVFGSGPKTKNKMFDVISIKMSMHFMFRSDETLTNCCTNFNRYLKHNGHVLITTIDGKMLHEILKNNDSFTSHYTSETGEKHLLFEYKKKYNGNDINKTGLQVDFHIASFNEAGTYTPEYLVDPTFLIDTLRKKCGLKLIDTDTFENQHKIYKYFFDEVAPYEANEKTRQYFSKVKDFYDMTNEINKGSFEFSRLHRYYVFQKI